MKYPSVTEILSPYADFSHVPADVLAAAALRGTGTHEACAGYALDLWSSVSDELRGYFDSYRAWFDRYVVEVLAVEKELVHKRWGYIGHADLVARVSGYKTEPVIGVIDIKTPLTQKKTWRLQISAYVEAEQQERKEKVYGGALQLRKDGGLPKMTWVEDQSQAFAAFTGALSAHNYIKGNEGK